MFDTKHLCHQDTHMTQEDSCDIKMHPHFCAVYSLGQRKETAEYLEQNVRYFPAGQKSSVRVLQCHHFMLIPNYCAPSHIHFVIRCSVTSPLGLKWTLLQQERYLDKIMKTYSML